MFALQYRIDPDLESQIIANSSAAKPHIWAGRGFGV